MNTCKISGTLIECVVTNYNIILFKLRTRKQTTKLQAIL